MVEEEREKLYFILIIIVLSIFLSIVLMIDLIDKEEKEINYCEEYAKANKISISYPEKDYTFNNITIDEKTLKEDCLK